MMRFIPRTEVDCCETCLQIGKGPSEKQTHHSPPFSSQFGLGPVNVLLLKYQTYFCFKVWLAHNKHRSSCVGGDDAIDKVLILQNKKHRVAPKSWEWTVSFIRHQRVYLLLSQSLCSTFMHENRKKSKWRVEAHKTWEIINPCYLHKGENSLGSLNVIKNVAQSQVIPVLLIFQFHSYYKQAEYPFFAQSTAKK